MKQINLIAQSKGGSGKSFTTWFFAYLNKNDNTIFIDLDQSTRTSAKRLGNIIDENRIWKKTIVDNNNKLDREKFLDLFEEISQNDTDKFYVDFGATESEELLRFIKSDYSAEELKEVLQELGLELKIYIVIAGKDAFQASIEYLLTMNKLLSPHIEVVALKNEGTYKDLVELDSTDEILEKLKIKVHKVCYTPLGGSSSEIINLIGGKIKENELKLAGKLGLKKMVENFKLVES